MAEPEKKKALSDEEFLSKYSAGDPRLAELPSDADIKAMEDGDKKENAILRKENVNNKIEKELSQLKKGIMDEVPDVEEADIQNYILARRDEDPLEQFKQAGAIYKAQAEAEEESKGGKRLGSPRSSDEDPPGGGKGNQTDDRFGISGWLKKNKGKK